MSSAYAHSCRLIILESVRSRCSYHLDSVESAISGTDVGVINRFSVQC